MYGCGHAVRTPCPRPRPITTNASTGTAGSIRSKASTSNQGSPRRGSNNTNASSNASANLTPISKFCNGFPSNPKETTAPCYNCILADAKCKVQLEKPEVEAKKEELRRDGMTQTIARGLDGRYVDEFGNKIIAEEEYEQESEYGGRGRDRGFTGGRGSGNGRYARIDHAANGLQDRRTSAAGAFAGNGGFRGGPRGGGLPNGFEPPRYSYNTEYDVGFQARHGAGLLPGFGPPYNNAHSQQYFQSDFGGASWGQAGGLGSGLDAGSMYQQPDTSHFNARRF